MRRTRFVIILSLLFTLTLGAVLSPIMLVRAGAGGFTFNASKGVIVNDGVDSTDVTVSVTDDGNPVPDGTPITFAVTPSDPGIVTSALSVTTTGGNATINIKSSASVAAVSAIHVTATNTDVSCTSNCTSSQFDFAVVDAALPSQPVSTIAASLSSVPADNTASTITVTLRNAASNPVAGITVSLTADVAGPTITTVSGTTDAGGVATFTTSWLNRDLAASQVVNYTTNTITGDSQSGNFTLPVSVTFTTPALPSDGPSTVVAAPTSIVANNTATSLVTVTLLNAANAPVAGKTITLVETTAVGGITIAPAAAGSDITNASGVATFTVKGSVVGAATFQATDTTDSVTLAADPVTITLVSPLPAEGPTTVSAAPLAIPANNLTTSTITVTLRDTLSGPVQGKTVTLAQTAGATGITVTPVQPVTDASGVATFTVKGTTPGTATFQATDTTDGIPFPNDPVTITLTTPPADKTNSTVTSDKLALYANNTEVATITVTLKDINGNPAGNKTVNLQASLPAGVSVNGQPYPLWPNQVTNAAGVATFTVKSNTAYASDVFTVNDITDNVLLNDAADQITLTFIEPVADKTQSQVFVDKTSVFANGTDSATITVLVRDVTGFPVPNKSVSVFAVSFPGIIINDQPAPYSPRTTNGNGLATFTVKSNSIAPGVTFVFRIDTDGILLDDPADVPIISFVAPVPTNTPTNTPTLTPTGPTPTSTAAPGTSPIFSTVYCNYSQAPADGVFRVTISISLRDQNNQPVPNHLPVPSVTPPTAGLSFSSPALTDVNGNVTYYVSSVTQTAPNAVIVSVTDQTASPPVTLSQTCSIIFAAPGSTPVVGATPIGGLTTTPIGTVVVTATATPTAGLMNANSQGPITGIVVAYRLRVRTGPGLNYEILGLLRYKVTIVLLGRNRAGTWLLTQLDDGRQVWVSSRWVKVSRARFRRLPLIAVPTRTPVFVNPSSFVVPSQGQGVGTANVAMLNAYSDPSQDATVVGMLPRGTEMLVLGKSTDGNWYYVEIGDNHVWVPATYVSLNKINGSTLGVVNPLSSS